MSSPRVTARTMAALPPGAWQEGAAAVTRYRLDRIDAALAQWGARPMSIEDQAYDDWLDTFANDVDFTESPEVR